MVTSSALTSTGRTSFATCILKWVLISLPDLSLFWYVASLRGKKKKNRVISWKGKVTERILYPLFYCPATAGTGPGQGKTKSPGLHRSPLGMVVLSTKYSGYSAGFPGSLEGRRSEAENLGLKLTCQHVKKASQVAVYTHHTTISGYLILF